MKPVRSKPRAKRPADVPRPADDDTAAVARALGHPARVTILRLLLERGDCICGDIVERLPLAQATVSQHLKVLREAGLIEGEVDGPRVCYCVNPERLETFQARLGDLLAKRRRIRK